MTDEAKKLEREYQRRYYAEHRQERNEYQRQWRKENPDRVRAYNAAYWNRKVAQAAKAAADQKQE